MNADIPAAPVWLLRRHGVQTHRDICMVYLQFPQAEAEFVDSPLTLYGRKDRLEVFIFWLAPIIFSCQTR